MDGLMIVAALTSTLTASLVGGVLPQPQSVVLTGASVSLQGVRVVAPRGLATEMAEARQALAELGVPSQGTPLRLRIDQGASANAEGYRLVVRKGLLSISAPTPHGIFNGIQSLRQLVRREGESFAAPALTVVDAPRFAWRGLMLDVSRHFFPVEDVKRMIDQASRYKINTFHWHLNDDGGWRIEIKKYPELTRRGAWRTPANGDWLDYDRMDFPPTSDPQPKYGGYYTQDQIKEVVAYAATKHVTVVPEIEMPGHNLAATISHQELACSKDLVEPWRKEAGFSFPNIICAGKESSYSFVQDVLDEVLELFPSKNIHVGGDEVDKWLWQRCPDCQATMKREGHKNAAELESYFIMRVEKYLNSKGRSIVGWDEILEGGIAPSAKVMSWRGTVGGIEAAKLGHEVVMAAHEWMYLNVGQGELPMEKVYSFQPVPAAIPAEQRKYVIGGEACLWTEGIPNREVAEGHVFPRLAAVAQVLWTAQPEPFADFSRRLAAHMPLMAKLAPDFFVAGPSAEFGIVSPEQSVMVVAPFVPGTVTRYRVSRGLSPTLPDAASPEYAAPLTLEPGTVVSAARMRGAKVVGEPVVVRCVELRPESPPQTTPGLVSELFEGRYDLLPDFGKLSLKSSRVTNSVVAEDRDREWYAQVLSGYFRAPVKGKYRFYLGADDGAAAYLGRAKLLDHDGLHGYTEKSAAVLLQPGRYPLRVEFFQATGAARLTLRYSIDDGPVREAGPELFHVPLVQG